MDKKKSLSAAFGAMFGFGVGRLVDIALVGGSLAVASGSVGFAGYMTLAGSHVPHVNGMQYLAIFAQPSRKPPGKAETLDAAPVGSVSREAKTTAGGYAMVGATSSYGWLRQGNRIFAVRPGDDVDGLGHVTAIEQRGGRWALVDAAGAELIVSGVSTLAPEDGGRFQKRMIFGER